MEVLGILSAWIAGWLLCFAPTADAQPPAPADSTTVVQPECWTQLDARLSRNQWVTLWTFDGQEYRGKILDKESASASLALQVYDAKASRFEPQEFPAASIDRVSWESSPAWPVAVGAIVVGVLGGMAGAGYASIDDTDDADPAAPIVAGAVFGALAGGVAGALLSSIFATPETLDCGATP